MINKIKTKIINGEMKPNAKDNYPVILGAKYGDLNFIKFLCGFNEVDPHDCNYHALEIATKIGHLEVVKYLVEVRNFIVPKTILTLNLIEACLNNHSEIVEYLCKRTNIVKHFRYKVLKFTISKNGIDLENNFIKIMLEKQYESIIISLFRNKYLKFYNFEFWVHQISSSRSIVFLDYFIRKCQNRNNSYYSSLLTEIMNKKNYKLLKFMCLNYKSEILDHIMTILFSFHDVSIIKILMSIYPRIYNMYYNVHHIYCMLLLPKSSYTDCKIIL